MIALQAKARDLLERNVVQVVIGYAAGSAPSRSRPVFVRRPEQAGHLIMDERCRQNLTVYLLKPEVAALGKAAVVAQPPALRAVLQLAAESQLRGESVLALTVTDEGTVVELAGFAAVEEFLASAPRNKPTIDQELDVLLQMPLTDRWNFWREEFSRCIRCYACRAACPLCYCSRCITDCNRPQWVPVAADDFGNLDWNVVRALHLAGRCVECGSCADACPQGIRIDLLNRLLAREAAEHFGAAPGYSTRKEYALAAFQPDDKETFIR